MGTDLGNQITQSEKRITTQISELGLDIDNHDKRLQKVEEWKSTQEGIKSGVFATSNFIYVLLLAAMTVLATFFGYKTYKNEISKETIIRTE